MGVRLTSHWIAAAFTGREWMSERTGFFYCRKCESHGGIILTGKNRRTRRKTCPSATLSTTNPTGLTRVRSRAAVVRGRRLIAWAMARPIRVLLNSLTQCSRVLRKIIAAYAQLVKFPAFYETRRFITMFTRIRQRSLSWVRWISSIPSKPTSVWPSNVDSSLQAFQPKLFSNFSSPSLRATCPAHLILLD
jgi:hypothetical protein